jgi:hypothetical protein
MKKYASDVFVQAVCTCVLYLATNKKYDFIHKLCSDGACSAILAAIDVIVSDKKARKALPRGCKEDDLLLQCFSVIRSLFESPSDAREEPRLHAICRAMAKFKDDSDVLADAIFTLSMATKYCLKNLVVIGQEGIDSIVTAMKGYQEVAHLQFNAFAALSALADVFTNDMKRFALSLVFGATPMSMKELLSAASCSFDNARYIAKIDLLRIFVEINQRHMDSIKVQTSGAQLYCALAGLKDAHVNEMLVNEGCVRVVVKSMKRYKDLTFILQEGMSDLMSLGSRMFSTMAGDLRSDHKQLTNELKTRIVQQGAGDEIIYVMSVRKDKRAQDQCFSFLYQIIIDHPGNTKALGYEALPVVLGYMRTQKPEANHLGKGCLLLNSILKGPCDALAESKDEPADPSPVEQHAENSALQEPQDSSAAKELTQSTGQVSHGANHAELLGTQRKYQDELARCGGVSVLVDFLELHLKNCSTQTDKDSTGFVSAACSAISHAAYQHAKNQAMFGKKGANSVLLRVFKVYGGSEHVLCTARKALEQLAAPVQRACMPRDSETEQCGNDCVHLDGGEKELFACIACGKTAAMMGGKKLLHCSACTLAPCYCSVECQRACWKEHKAECNANKKQS